MHAEKFDLNATISACSQAFTILFCHLLFDVAWHGIIIALLIGLAGFILTKKQNKFGKPFIAVCRKLTIFCSFLMLPGIIFFAIYKHLPPMGFFQFSSLGYLILWCFVSVHIVGEEMNFEWFS